MAVISSAGMDVNCAYFISKRRTTRRFSYKLLSRLGAIVVTSRSRHFLGEKEVTTKVPESRTQISAKLLFADGFVKLYAIWRRCQTGYWPT